MISLWVLCSSWAFAQPSPSLTNGVRLSPIPKSVSFSKLVRISLNGKWHFQVKGKYDDQILVPSEWEMKKFSLSEGETAIYTKEFDLPATWEGSAIKIRFDAVSTHALVKINGQAVGEHEGGFVPFEVDITRALKSENNVLQVEVQSPTISDHLSVVSQYASHTVGGILRKVTLFALPQLNISSFTWQTTFDNNYKNASLNLLSEITNESHSRKTSLSIHYLLEDDQGTIVAQKVFPLTELATNEHQHFEHTLPITHPKPWTPETPYLYTLTTELLEKKQVLQTNRHKVGFREIKVEGNLLLVNGVAVKLKGVCRHSVHPLSGRALGTDMDKKDAQLFKAGNCNYIRTSHYPPSEEFLQACDELGLFVESEAALCWIGHGATPFWKTHNYKDTAYLPYLIRANIDNVLAGRNHPSVLIWSLANESVWSPLWEIVNTKVKELDPSRPTSFHDQCWGGYNHAGSTADIAVYHYPDIKGPAACDTMSRPVLFGEYAHVSCYNRKELLADPGIRGLYGKPLEEMNDEMYAHPANLGGAIWAAIDDIFRMPDGNIIGYGPWGPIDGWRRPKPEYWGMKKAYTPVRVFNANTVTPSKKTLTLELQNRYDFTNLNALNIVCKVDDNSRNITAPNIPPHEKGTLTIPVSSNEKTVYIAFVDPTGNIVNEEKITLQKPTLPKFDEVQQVTLTENAESFFVERAGIKFTISKLFGTILSAQQGNEIILTKGPTWGVVENSDESDSRPSLSMSYQNDIAPQRDYSYLSFGAKEIRAEKNTSGVKIVAKVLMSNWKTTVTVDYEYLFNVNGTVEVNYAVAYPEDAPKISARQYGMFFELPQTFDALTWYRKGEFTTYPEDDIARTKGEALLSPSFSQRSAEVIGKVPIGAWKEDATEIGSNDFIATKNAIYQASLTNATGVLFSVFSEGNQAWRSWLHRGRIQVLIADYNGYGAEPFYSTPFKKPQPQWKGNTIKGTLRFSVQ